MATTAELLGGLFNTGGLAASAYLPYQESGEQLDYLKAQIPQYVSRAEEIGQQAAQAAQFTPFTVKTATGGTTSVGAGGGYEQQLGAAEQALQNQLFSQAGTLAGQTVDPTQYAAMQQQAMQGAFNALGQPTASAQDIYNQMQASQAGELQRARTALENRLAAQGRLGVQTSAFGGTPEALAMEKAAQEQMSNNWLQAQQLAPQLAAQQTAQASNLFGLGSQAAAMPSSLTAANLANVGTALGTAYAPQQQQLSALTPAAQLANIATSSGLGQSEALYKAGTTGLTAQATGAGAISSLEQGRVNALADALSGLFTASAGSQTSPLQGLITDLFSPASSSTQVSDDAFLQAMYEDLKNRLGG